MIDIKMIFATDIFKAPPDSIYFLQSYFVILVISIQLLIGEKYLKRKSPTNWAFKNVGKESI
ncbi:MAG: hypothetical protein A2V66_05930 [Ignavibacteria bacterium RBG_13_36_8]|nr:MAG: hypothetical protein A2V66_05930 [Ignavibacteria bacterium RBG_13_36_8]